MILSYREKLEKKFREEYARLNSFQQKAVDTIEGPVMVIAGPGTGKTQILAARIGKILLETDARPDNILCLTYTDAGALAMRKRLIEFIGSDAYKVAIHTFHAFCNEVIQDNLAYFEKSSLSPISELESIQLFRELVDGFQKDHLLKRTRGDVYYEARHLRSLFSTMKREGWSPEFINSCIDSHIESLFTNDAYICKKATNGFKKGDVRTDKIDIEKEKFEKLRAAVNEFSNYLDLMNKKHRYDFDDMIKWVIAAFEEDANLLANYQEQYQYVLVDEYQDTSGSQNRLVSLLINYWDKPNVFVVGDDDQSIFRFQGANVENMMDFRKGYEQDIVTVVLSHNYRSTQPILDVSKKLIDRNEERLINDIDGLSKDLVAWGKEVMDIKTPPRIIEYDSLRDEMAGITMAIEDLIAKQVPAGEIAVIYSKHKVGLELARYLQLRKIPVYTKKNINLFQEPFAKKIFTLLRYLSEEHDVSFSGDENLFKILHFDFYSIPAIDIARITVEAGKKENKMPLRKMLSNIAASPAPDLFTSPLDPKLAAFSLMLEKLISHVPNETLQQLFEKVITEGGILSYVLNSESRHYLMRVLTALFDFIKDETARNPYMDIHELMEVIDIMKKEGIVLPLVQVSGNEKGVNLLSAHGAKGLEFEHVFLAGCVSSLWEKHREPGGGFKLPATVFSASKSHSKIEELRRLFYVALTRAKKSLIVSYAMHDHTGKNFEPSMFVEEIKDLSQITFEKAVIDDEVKFTFETLHFTPMAPEIARSEEDFIGPLIDRFTMNVTALSTYLRCPIEFYYKNLVRIPAGKSESLVFGSAVHYAMDRLFNKMLQLKKKEGIDAFPPKEELLKDFAFYMQNHREGFTKQNFQRRMEHGEKILPAYYDQYVNIWNKVTLTEMNIRGASVNGIPIRGQIDKLEFDNKNVNVVDYKTGLPENAAEKLNPPDDKNPNGGDYWRQAVFYKILLEGHKGKEWNVVSAEFDFIEPDRSKKFKKYRVPISAADIETVKQQITTVYEKIMARDFYIGCGKEKCEWCHFVKDNKMAIRLHELRGEDEERENQTAA